MTIVEYLAHLQNQNDRVKFDAVVASLKARDYVLNHLPDVHVVRTDEKGPHGGCHWVGVYSVALGLNKRQLIDTARAAAPQLVGTTFRFDNDTHPDYVFALKCWPTAECQLKALYQFQEEQQNAKIRQYSQSHAALSLR